MARLNRPMWNPMARITVYSTGRCPICEKTKALLTKWRIPYKESRIDQDSAAMREFIRITKGARTVPQIAIDGRWIGGFTELTEMHMESELDDFMDDKAPT